MHTYKQYCEKCSFLLIKSEKTIDDFCKLIENRGFLLSKMLIVSAVTFLFSPV